MTVKSLIPFTTGQVVALQVGEGPQATRRLIKVVSNDDDRCLCEDNELYDRETGRCTSNNSVYRAIHTPGYQEIVHGKQKTDEG